MSISADMLSLPDLLFSRGSVNIVQGSVLFLYCHIYSAAPSLRVNWTKDNITLVQNLPHIRMRLSTDIANSTTLLLIVDFFMSRDNGVYQCTAEEPGRVYMGSTLELTGTPTVVVSMVLQVPYFVVSQCHFYKWVLILATINGAQIPSLCGASSIRQ
jgi:hypothetical protein